MGISQQIGASSLIKPGVIDNAAARPASPYEGQVIFQKDTDQLLVWNGTVWVIPNSPAQNPTGLEYITSANPSGVSSVSIDNCFSATYNAYRIVWIPTAYSSTSACETNMRLRASGTDNTSSNYLRSRWYYGGGGSSGTDGGATTTTLWALSDSHTPLHPISADVYSPYQSVRTSIGSKAVSFQLGTTLFGIESVGITSVSTVYDGFTWFPANGTFTGKLLVYGYRQ